MDVLVARQAIFDRDRRVYGYELLFRSHAAQTAFDDTEAGLATQQVLANSLLAIGLDNLVGSGKAFINFGRAPLLQGWHASLPRERTVIEVLETVEPDDEVLEACQRLRDEGYRIALDDFVFKPGWERLVRVADLVKIEIQVMPRSDQERFVQRSKFQGLKVVAEKVETYEEFHWARQTGYDYFQGYFFARPVTVRGRQIPANKLHCLRLLQEAQRPDLDFDRLERLITEDVSLSYQLLRYVNSPLLSLTGTIRSIGQALLIFGETELRKWIALATLARTSEDKPRELIRHSLMRARFCELLAATSRQNLSQAAFLTGLFSLLDALMDRPLEQTLSEISLAPEISDVLQGNAPLADPLAAAYELALAYETADWAHVEQLAVQLRIPISGLSGIYCAAAAWAQQVLEPIAAGG